MARLIDADALMEKFWVTGDFEKDLWHSITIRSVIDDAPTVDAVPVVHGRWSPVYTCSGEWLWGYNCSHCKADGPRLTLYCPNCGAKMDLGVE